jgi:RNA polymerase sigma-70 factor (ECF subfamily)
MPPEEQRLIKRLKARDEDAFRELVRTHQNQVYNLVFRMLGHRAEAEDVAQEVFVTVFKAIDSFREESRRSTWLFRVAANHAKNRLKYLARRRGDRQASLDDLTDRELHQVPRPAHAQPDGAALSRELEAQIQSALATLEEEQRLVLVLRDMENLSYEEVSEITGLPLGTVKSRIHRARAALRAVLRQIEKAETTRAGK